MTLAVILLGLTGCSSAPLITTVDTTPPYPSQLLVHCENYEEYPSGILKEIIIIHAENMEKAQICKLRANTLMDLIRDREVNQ